MIRYALCHTYKYTPLCNAIHYVTLYSTQEPGIVLMRTNVNLLNRVPEHDCPPFSCYTERNVNQCILNGSVFQTRERESVRRQYSAPSSYIYVNISDILSRPLQKLKRTCSTERAFLRQLTCSTNRNGREKER